MLIALHAVDYAYFDGPDGLEKGEVIIFDKLPNLQSYNKSVLVGPSCTIMHARRLWKAHGAM